MSGYHPANTKLQWFQDDYPGSPLKLTADTMVAVLHTTEGTTWPSYDGGATAPNYTGLPPLPQISKGVWRQHFPDERSARALRNEDGGVQTNTLNAVQFELIGTCDPRNSKRWGGTSSTRVAGKDYVYWPDASEKQLDWVARILADMNVRHGLQLVSNKLWRPYPDSYGANNVRMTDREWLNAVGVYGHQHIPENSHGDPGNIRIKYILRRAREFAAARKEVK